MPYAFMKQTCSYATLSIMLLTGCQQESIDIAPAPTASLQGLWQMGITYVKSIDVQGRQTMKTLPASQSPQLVAIDNMYWKYTGGGPANNYHYKYQRKDTIIYEIHDVLPILNDSSSIVELTAHRLVTRRETTSDPITGEHIIVKQEYTR